MSDRYVIEAMLRPAVELNTAVVAACASYICVTARGRWHWRLQSAMSRRQGLPYCR